MTRGLSASGVAPFVGKLFDLVTQCETDGLVCWGLLGESFILLDTRAFSSFVLPMYFKHDNLRSFERQLNIYGFQRCADQPTPQALEFFHPKFRRGEREILAEIKRGAPAPKRPFGERCEDLPVWAQGQLADLRQQICALHDEVKASEAAAGKLADLAEKVARAVVTARKAQKRARGVPD